uniref:T9SS type A sorting domain-containing protein n=1 Tax=candidate division WOR-3 bacterium TaxID=2052148 RepID=A0A7C4TC63_UNCW3
MLSQCLVIIGFLYGLSSIESPYYPDGSYSPKGNSVITPNFATRSLLTEFIVDTSIVLTTDNDQVLASVTFGDTNYFVVWCDRRAANGWNIFGARVSPNGTIIDICGIPISTAIGDQWYPTSAFDGTNYFVVWGDKRSGIWDIYGARVSNNGVVLDSTGILISSAANDQVAPNIGYDGINYFIVWMDKRSGVDSDIYGTRVTPQGIILDPSGIPISVASSDQKSPSVAFDGTNYFVVWSDCRNGASDIYGARVTRAGIVLDANGIAISTAPDSQQLPAIAYDGTNYLVVWSDLRGGSNYDIYGARVMQTGSVLDPSGILISNAASHQWSPKITYDSTSANYLCVWMDYRNGFPDIYGTRITELGVVLDPSGIVISNAQNEQYFPAVSFDGENYFSVWDDCRTGIDIFGARISPSGNVLDPTGILISTEPAQQNYASTIYDGSNYFVVWTQGYWDDDIYGVRIDSSGVMVDSVSIAISTAPNHQVAQGAAFNEGDSQYLVVWRDRRSGSTWDIYGARVSSHGILLDPTGFAISTASGNKWSAAVVYGDTNYFVVWENIYIYGARVNSQGVVLDPGGIQISSTAGNSPSIVFDGTNYFVVWSTGDIYGARVTQSGIVLDPSGIPISTASGTQNTPRLVFDGVKYFVCWADGRNGNLDIYGARVGLDGVLIDTVGIAVSTADGSQLYPSVSFDGTNYFVVWEDQRAGVFCDDIYGARVTTGGIVLDPGGLELINVDYAREYPMVAHGPGDQLFISFHGIAPEFYYVSRILGAFYHGTGIEETTNMQPEIQNSQLTVYPIPCHKQLTIKFQIPNNSEVEKATRSQKSAFSIRIYDANGRLLRQWDYETIGLSDQIIWDGTNDFGRRLPAGIYFVRLESNEFKRTEKVILLR